MKTPQEPLRALLAPDATEREIRDMWMGIERLRTQKPVILARWMARSALVSAAVLVVGFALWIFRGSSAGPLRDIEGHVLIRLGGAVAVSAGLSDGSRIDLDADSGLEVLDNDSTIFSSALRKGRATFDVKPGGPRRWRVEAGSVVVEVVGTRFVVDRRPDETRVVVERGTVLVRGERVPDGVQKLVAGNEIVVANGARVANPPPAVESSAPVASTPVEAVGSPSTAKSPVDLLDLADQQRRRGDVHAAVQTLKTAVNRLSVESRRSIAAFTLGKLLLDSEDQPAEAESAFRTCLRLSPPTSVAEDALARLVEAQARAGHADAARATARNYEKRYPAGRRLADVERWAGTP